MPVVNRIGSKTDMQSTERSCATCIFAELSDGQGECRRLPPSIVAGLSRDGRWPIIHPLHWCGEYSAKVGV